MFKYIALALLVATSLATFSVDLKANVITDNQFVSYQTGSGQTMQWVSSAAPELLIGDTVYTYTAKIGDEKQAVVFDTTVGNNWQFVESTTPLIAGDETIEAAQGRNTLTKAKATELTKVNFDGKNLKNVKVYQSNQPNPNINKSTFKAAQYGFALNRQSYKNFFKSLEQSEVKLEKSGQGFSFYFSEQVNQLFFGVPQKFFTTEPLKKVDAKSSTNDNHWTVAIKRAGISLKGLDALHYLDPAYAQFDSTTKYIWASDDIVDSIIGQLNSNQLGCLDVNQVHPVGIYNCNEGIFPALQLQFRTNDTSDAEDTKVYEVKKYTEKLDGGKVRLLIRKSGLYQNIANGTNTKVPSTYLNNKTSNLLILGTVFLENVYTYFSYDDHTVNFAESFKLTPQKKDITSSWRIWFLVLGALAALGATALILSLLSKVPYNPATQQQALPQAPVQNITYVPQAVSYVKQSQPIYYVQPQQSSYSPTRVIQSGYQPQSYVVQQQPVLYQ